MLADAYPQLASQVTTPTDTTTRTKGLTDKNESGATDMNDIPTTSSRNLLAGLGSRFTDALLSRYTPEPAPAPAVTVLSPTQDGGAMVIPVSGAAGVGGGATLIPVSGSGLGLNLLPVSGYGVPTTPPVVVMVRECTPTG